MKKALPVLNVFATVVLTVINVMCIVTHGLDNDGWLIVILAGICLCIYILGLVCPDKIVKSIYKLSERIYQKSNTISIPVEEEALRIFKKRLIYLLSTANILLILLMLKVLLS